MERLKRWARRLKQNIYALYFVVRHPQVPRVAKIVASTVLAYALSPVDLIPDFIPLLGLLDDLVLVPLGIALVIRLVPRKVWEACRAEARTALSNRLPPNRVAAGVIIGLWLAALLITIRLAWIRFR